MSVFDPIIFLGAIVVFGVCLRQPLHENVALLFIAYIIQTFRLLFIQRLNRKPKAVNIIKDVVLPTPDDPRWKLSTGGVTREFTSPHGGTRFSKVIETTLYSLDNIDVEFQPGGQNIFDDYEVTINGSSDVFTGFAVKRYWRAIRYAHTQRHAMKAIESA